ncbi:MAG: TauD/TfdA family dioxygenase [Bacteroidetes bacterium]|nr:TauD/TfdA family dioxygenase [Bacteroidota bacterium]
MGVSTDKVRFEGSLTASGKGRVIDLSNLSSDILDSMDWKQVLFEHGFLVLRNVGSRLEDARSIMSRLGDLVEHEKRNDGVLELDGSHDEDEALRSHDHMPLHKDGILMGLEVNVVGIYCKLRKNLAGGRTFITDVRAAMQDMDPGHLKTLETNGIEGQAVDTSYYFAEGGIWHPIPAITHLKDGKFLHMGFPYREEERASWKVRVAGISGSTSDTILNSMEQILMNEAYVYYHAWKEGDMLLLDNQRVLHGREAYTGDRTLVNMQVIYN